MAAIRVGRGIESRGKLGLFVSRQKDKGSGGNVAVEYNENCIGPQCVSRALCHICGKQGTKCIWVGFRSIPGGTLPYLAPCFAGKAGLDALASPDERACSHRGLTAAIVVLGLYPSGANHVANAAFLVLILLW